MQRLLFCLTIIIITIIVFLNSLHNDFQLDDYYRVVDNPGIQKLMPLHRHFFDPRTMSTYRGIVQFRPMLPLTLSVNYAISGDSLAGYHIGNILFQVIAGLLVFFVILELLNQVEAFKKRKADRLSVAFFTSLIFSIHPVSGMLVNYISGRDLILMQLFLSASFLAYMLMRRKGETALGWSAVILLGMLSILSKTNASAYPLLILAYELIIRREKWYDKKLWLRTVPFVLIVVFFFVYTNWLLDFSDVSQLKSEHGQASLYSLPTQARIHFEDYLPNFLFPYLIHIQAQAQYVSYSDPRALAALVMLAGTVMLAWILRKRHPLISFSILAYWIMLAPTSSVIPFHTIRADYRPYPSSPYFYLTIIYLVHRFLKSNMKIIFSGGLAVYFGIFSIFMNQIWETKESLWTHSVKLGGTALAHHNLAMGTQDMNKRKRLLEQALKIRPEHIFTNINLGLTKISLGEEDGLEDVKKGAAYGAELAFAQYWLAVAYYRLGHYEDAFEVMKKTAEMDPESIKYNYEAVIYAQRIDRHEEALKFAEKVMKLDPNYENTGFLYAFSLQKLGRKDEAVREYKKYIRRNSDDSKAWFNLGYALMKEQKWKEAIESFNRALQYEPDDTTVHYHLYQCYNELGQKEKAEHHLALYYK